MTRFAVFFADAGLCLGKIWPWPSVVNLKFEFRS
jgi:hypothetical protein